MIKVAMGKKTLVILATVLTFLGLLQLPKSASAHILATDGNMEVTLHIRPDDDPVAGEPQILVFLYYDSLDVFNAQQCSCVVTIQKNGQTLDHQTSTAPTAYFGQLPYTFKSQGVYNVYLSGTPIAGASFQPFKVSYYFRVTGNGSPSQPNRISQQKGSSGSNQALIVVGAVAAVGLVMAGAVFYNNIKEGRKR
ncbi:MAG TPA: hypothetical protein VMT23_02435 [Candidatus Binatia bacterium]|nr:hypothetical protein [Candidatus Binatia bacterium]